MTWRDLRHEEPPENGAKYLVFIPSIGGGPPRSLLARWINPPEEFEGMTFHWGGIFNEVAHQITHWMPLPPPPDASAEDEDPAPENPALFPECLIQLEGTIRFAARAVERLEGELTQVRRERDALIERCLNPEPAGYWSVRDRDFPNFAPVFPTRDRAEAWLLREVRK